MVEGESSLLSPPSAGRGTQLTMVALIKTPRFNGLIRPYTAEQVVSKRGTIELAYPSNAQGKKLFALLSKKAAKGEVSHTYGA